MKRKILSKKWFWILIGAVVIIGIIGDLTGFGDDTDNSSKSSSSVKKEAKSEDKKSKAEESSKKARSEAVSSSKKAKAEAESKSKAEAEAMSKSKKEASQKKEQDDYNKLVQAVASLPAQSKNVITSASIDKDTNFLMLTMTDEALSTSDAELKNLVKSAWEIGTSLIQKYPPYPKDKVSSMVVVQDSAGNRLGHTSITGDFKYDADK